MIGKQPEQPTVRQIDHSYESSNAELEEDLRIDATFEETARAVTQTGKVESRKPPKRHRQAN